MNNRVKQGLIYKALSGFYYVSADGKNLTECRARGKFRLSGKTPLVGDFVLYSETEQGKGILEEILPRRNSFIRPPVANIDLLIVVVSEVNPVSDPFLIDRILAVAEHSSCDCVICINKCDMKKSDRLLNIYQNTGYKAFYTSCETGEGIEALTCAAANKTCSFVGNSGVGKSSLLNALEPGFEIKTADVSQKLGRGRHTTRHVELYTLRNGAILADTPGFSSFDTERMDIIRKEEHQYLFREFAPYLGECMFNDCSHTSEKGCAVLEALERGEIHSSRHESYKRLYMSAKQIKNWEINKGQQ